MAMKFTSPMGGVARARLAQSVKPTDADEAANDAEFARCVADPGHFVDSHVIIDKVNDTGDEDGAGDGTQPFKLWEDQRAAMACLMSDRLVIFLKARQLGITWLCLGYALWLMLFHPGKVVLLFSQGEKEAVEMLRRLRVMYERLPEWMLARLPRRTRDNQSEQGWSNGSWCKSMPATQRAGRSFTASLVILDEAAHQQYGGQLYAALKPTIDAGGKLFIVSSANGSDGFFDKLWKKAVAGLNSFKAIFLSWRSRPDRDDAWYERQKAEATDPALLRQEYPSTPTEAFISSGRSRFPNEWIIEQSANVAARGLDPRHPEYPRGIARHDGTTVYEGPAYGRRYVLSADVAEGVAGGDYSTGVILDRESRAEIACYHGRLEPGDFAVRLDELGRAYDADLIVERNNHGHAVLLKLRDLKYPKVASGPDGRPGWVTNVTTKPQSIDLLAEGLRDGTIVVRSQATLDEMQAYQALDNGKTSAPVGEHDDRVMSWAIAVAWLRLCGQVRGMSTGRTPGLGYRG